MTLELWLRIAGGSLQLAGVWMVAWEIRRANQRFAPERVGRTKQRMRKLWRKLLRRKPEPTVIRGGVASLEASGGATARGTVVQDPDKLDMEGKVDELFRRYDQLRDDLQHHRYQQRERQHQVDERLAEERGERSEADRDLRDQVKDLATSGVRIRWYASRCSRPASCS